MVPRRILVTGATGFIGRPTVAALVEAGCEVHALTRDASSQTALPHGVTPHGHDLLRDDPAPLMASIRPDTLLHLAWETSHGAFWRSPANADWVAATRRLAQAFVEAGGRRIIGVGTAYEYAREAAGRGPLDETAPLGPGTPYAAAKDQCHRALQAITADHDVSLAWARLFLLYGPGEDARRLIPAVAAALRRGERPLAFGADQRRDLMHSADAGRALALLALSDATGAVNVASGEGPTLAEVIGQVAATLGLPPPAIDIRPPRPQDAAMLVADVTRLNALGFVPRHALSVGLRTVLSGS